MAGGLNGASKPAGCQSCPLASLPGFVLGSGDPSRARIAICLESPWRDEIEYLLSSGTVVDANTERAVRRRDYPDLPARFVERGIPAAGWTGRWMESAGIDRLEAFVDNVLRCPMRPGTYPSGKKAKLATASCRQYDRWEKFLDETSLILVTLHPASLARDPAPTSLVLHDFRRALQLSGQGKVLIAAGLKAAQLFLPYIRNITRWRGHVEPYSLSRWKERLKELE